MQQPENVIVKFFTEKLEKMAKLEIALKSNGSTVNSQYRMCNFAKILLLKLKILSFIVKKKKRFNWLRWTNNVLYFSNVRHQSRDVLMIVWAWFQIFKGERINPLFARNVAREIYVIAGCVARQVGSQSNACLFPKLLHSSLPCDACTSHCLYILNRCPNFRQGNF